MNARELAQTLAGSGNPGLNAGALIHQAEKARRRGDTRTANMLTAASKELAERDRKHSTGSGTHPGNSARHRPVRDRGPLKPSDLAWLAGIAGRDPAKLSFEDAAAVAEILANLSPDERSDRRYVESIWRPIDEHHTQRINKARIDQIRQADTTLPAGTLDVVAKALAAELGDQFTEDEIHTRARALVDEAAANRGAQLYSQAQVAQENLDKLATDRAAREQVNR